MSGIFIEAFWVHFGSARKERLNYMTVFPREIHLPEKRLIYFTGSIFISLCISWMICPGQALAQGAANTLQSATPEQLKAGLAQLDAEIAQNPNSGKLYCMRANIYHFAKDDEHALTDLDKALELNPQDLIALGQRSELYARIHNYNLALADCTQAIKINPRSDVYLSNRGVIYRQLGQLRESFNDFNQALKINQKSAAYWFDVGEVLYRMNQYKGSIPYLTGAIDREKKFANAYYIRGLAYAKLGLTAQAQMDENVALGLGFKPNPMDFLH
jgi:tetratricopeptide (TPR) repeat protein